MVAGADYRITRFNLATRAKRQPGSAFKPFVYLAALEAGATPETLVPDAPDSERPWFPQNANRVFSYQPVSLASGLAHSINSIAARLTYQVGPHRVIDVAQRLGIASPLANNATIALGTSEVAPIELATAFSAFASGGYAIKPRFISEVADRGGRLLVQFTADLPTRVIAPRELSMINSMLKGVVERGTGTRAHIPGYEVAGKTGTTQQSRDAWFVGFTAYLTAAVWLGHVDGSPTKVAGGDLPAIIFQKFMREALRGLPARPLPGSKESAAMN